MITWSDLGTFLWYVFYPLYPILIILSILAANRSDWFLTGASLAGFQIATIMLVGRSIARQVTTRTKELERLISESKGT